MATIFTIDDDIDIMKVYRDVLSMNNHEIVAEALDGAEAVKIFKEMKKCPDIIIMDHRMPGKNGLEAMNDIRNINPLQGIIFVTADNEAAEQAIELGANSFILKPFKMDNLFNVIETTLSEIQEKEVGIRKTLLNIIVQIKSSDPVMLKRACDQIEKEIIDDYVHSLKAETETNLNTASNWACTLMNIAGFDFKHEKMENGHIQIINTKCYWMEKFGPNPVYCYITRGIISRFALKGDENVILDVYKTLMNNDDCCHFELKV